MEHKWDSFPLKCSKRLPGGTLKSASVTDASIKSSLRFNTLTIVDSRQELGDARLPFSFDVHAMIYSDDAPSLERELHRRFANRQVNRLNARKEFFQVPISEVREVVDSQQAEVHWTMAAEAWEYRESLALAGKQLQAVS
ncbi:GIY-YIG nuclease family protein [Vreelandella sp. EE22]